MKTFAENRKKVQKSPSVLKSTVGQNSIKAATKFNIFIVQYKNHRRSVFHFHVVPFTCNSYFNSKSLAINVFLAPVCEWRFVSYSVFTFYTLGVEFVHYSHLLNIFLGLSSFLTLPDFAWDPLGLESRWPYQCTTIKPMCSSFCTLNFAIQSPGCCIDSVSLWYEQDLLIHFYSC